MAATLSVREPGRTGVDLVLRVSTLGREARRVRDQLARVARVVMGEPEPGSVGPALALAYPDRVAQRRPGPPGRFRLANGRGAVLDGLDPLAAEPWLAVAELDDAGAEARIRRRQRWTLTYWRACSRTGWSRRSSAGSTGGPGRSRNAVSCAWAS